MFSPFEFQQEWNLQEEERTYFLSNIEDYEITSRDLWIFDVQDEYAECLESISLFFCMQPRSYLFYFHVNMCCARVEKKLKSMWHCLRTFGSVTNQTRPKLTRHKRQIHPPTMPIKPKKWELWWTIHRKRNVSVEHVRREKGEKFMSLCGHLPPNCFFSCLIFAYRKYFPFNMTFDYRVGTRPEHQRGEKMRWEKKGKGKSWRAEKIVCWTGYKLKEYIQLTWLERRNSRINVYLDTVYPISGMWQDWG